MKRREKINSRECFFETSFKAMGYNKKGFGFRGQGAGKKNSFQFTVDSLEQAKYS